MNNEFRWCREHIGGVSRDASTRSAKTSAFTAVVSFSHSSNLLSDNAKLESKTAAESKRLFIVVALLSPVIFAEPMNRLERRQDETSSKRTDGSDMDDSGSGYDGISIHSEMRSISPVFRSGCGQPILSKIGGHLNGTQTEQIAFFKRP